MCVLRLDVIWQMCCYRLKVCYTSVQKDKTGSFIEAFSNRLVGVLNGYCTRAARAPLC